MAEGIRTCFGVTRVAKNAVLLIDCEVRLPRQRNPIAVLGMTHESVKWLSFLTLNCASTIVGVEALPVDSYDSLSRNYTVAVSDFLTGQPEGSPLGPIKLHSVRRMTLDGFEFATDNVDPKIFERAVEF